MKRVSFQFESYSQPRTAFRPAPIRLWKEFGAFSIRFHFLENMFNKKLNFGLVPISIFQCFRGRVGQKSADLAQILSGT